MATEALHNVQTVLHYSYPLVVFLYFAISSVTIFSLPKRFAYGEKVNHKQQRLIFYLLSLFIASFGVQLVIKVIGFVSWRRWPSQHAVVGILYCLLVFGIEQNNMSIDQPISWPPLFGSWLISLILEPVNATLLFINAHDEAKAIHPEPSDNLLLLPLLEASIALIRFLILLSVVLVYFIWRHDKAEDIHHNTECAPLIPKPGRSLDTSTDSGYGTHSDATRIEVADTQRDNSLTTPRSLVNIEKKNTDENTLVSQLKKYRVLLHYIWPIVDRSIQLRIFLVGLCLLARNVLNFLIPWQYGALIDSITGSSDIGVWVQVGIYAVLQILSSSIGIELLQGMFWMPVQEAADNALVTAAYSHVINLSSAYYNSHSMADVLTTIRGASSPVSMLRNIFLNTGPAIIDIAVGFTYLSAKFGPNEGFITVATAVVYVQASTAAIAHVKERIAKSRDVVYKASKTLQDGIFGWQTVFDFNRQSYEEERYRSVVEERTELDLIARRADSVREIVQDFVVTAGLLAGAYLAIYQIRYGEATAGDFVMLLTYWAQVTRPFYSLFLMGKSVSTNLVSIERLVDMLLTKPTVVDKEDAKILEIKPGGGTVEFRNVTFSYDQKRNILENFSLTIPAGRKVAFVGSSGIGKTTILRLLTRRYDVTSGSILIDGQDIRDVTQFSLRDCIGIIPQHSFAFDDTIMNNIRYGRLDASEDDITEACKRAAIHNRIMEFDKQYEERVGERGVKLSGGELQRLSIARSILKKPHIVILDEATSSVDVETEQEVQNGLNSLCQGKTTIVVAHRLATVTDADVIFVMSKGKIIEQGNHEDLLQKRGKYAQLWNISLSTKPPPNEGESDNEATEGTQTPGTEDMQQRNEYIKGDLSTATYRKSAVSMKNTRQGIKTPEEQAVKTPDRYREEESRLNPGAPEFTPRSMAMLKPTPALPIQNTKAEHVAGGDSPKITPSIGMDSASFSTVLKVYDGSPTRKTRSRTATPEVDEATGELVPAVPELRLRRNTTQTVSCPEPSQSFHDSTFRSVSQPAPPSSPVRCPTPSRAATPPNDTQTSQEAVNLQVSEDVAGPITTETRSSSQGLPRGRGTSRGRRGRGRSRNGRGRRNLSSTRPSHSQNANSSGASRSSAPRQGPEYQ